MGHIRLLSSMEHSFSNKKSQFNENDEHEKQLKHLCGSEVLAKIETIQTKYEKVGGKKRRRCWDNNDYTTWSKRSILFDLPYWKVRYNFS